MVNLNYIQHMGPVDSERWSLLAYRISLIQERIFWAKVWEHDFQDTCEEYLEKQGL
jgi:hypothetical protein